MGLEYLSIYGKNRGEGYLILAWRLRTKECAYDTWVKKGYGVVHLLHVFFSLKRCIENSS